MDFDYYYGHFKDKNKSVAKQNVAHKTIRARMSGDLLKQFREHKSYSGIDESKFVRTLIKEALDKREADSWVEEIKDL